MQSRSVFAFYFDGKTSRRHSVKLTIDASIVCISGEAQRQAPLTELRVSERISGTARKITFVDGAYLEIADNDDFTALLASNVYHDSLVVRMQQRWRTTLQATAALILILLLGYLSTASRLRPDCQRLARVG